MPGMLPGMLSGTQLAACTGASLVDAAPFVAPMAAAMDRYAINTPIRIAMFLANVGHESSGLKRLRESLNYSADALIAKFDRARISRNDALTYGRTATHPADQEVIACLIYGGAWGRTRLGNVEPKDGWLFRGAGPMQHTGRANFSSLTERLRSRWPDLATPNFVAQPDLLVQPTWGALAAADYWDMRGLNTFADRGDFDGVCDLINRGKKTDAEGDSNGWVDRARIFAAGKTALKF